MLGKLGDLLNRDVGAIVKDAGKVLNSDVGTLAKGAGKMLNADLGDLLRSTPAPFAASEEVTPAHASTLPAAPQAKTPAPTPPAPAKPAAEKFDPDATLQIRKPPADAELSGANFDPDATMQVKRPPAMAADAAPIAAPTAAEIPRLTDELVQRHKRPMPTGTSVVQLLPYSVGEFERPHATPTGELTSDPVTAIYRVSGETIAVKLMQCWDADEAIERLNDIKSQSGENVRVANDGSWVLGQTAQGMVFAWNRDAYSFSVTSPKGIGTVARFLLYFPF